ncbi:uncharacterized protein (TIGR00255 family) [Rubricella aquisinus]|uniref:Uncharacterized protein (TIGR00255 family) n=1 Tax=Rubricella aquisinus TaxID=2028108 RepID=A0A840X132_9RHOB|nr:YicC/YloC family endoribonuclease [Rubricella aquisinus]MBB5516434.1 uncharacterized protein (TIGR00255 family) [Rubricella aquisinus]
MSLKSMTGFAQVPGQSGPYSWVWEARSVNGRGLEVRLRLPDAADGLEAPLRAAAKAALARGNVTIGLRLSRAQEEPGQAALSEAALSATMARLLQVEAAAQHAGVDLRAGTAAEILALPMLANATPDAPDHDWLDAAKAGIGPLFEAMTAARQAEGAALAVVLSAALDELETLVATAATQAAARANATRQSLRAKVNALLGEADSLDPGRLEQEMALLLVKSDVAEEIDRLRAHITAARALLIEDAPVGRKFDFLMQEFNREANTLCSKSGDVDLTQTGLAMKVVIDRMREQSQNIE